MRRTVTLQTMLHALIAAPVLPAATLSLAATLPLPAAAEEAQPVISIVTGLAPDDLLNIRATASAIGKTETRLAAGASVRNLGCNDFNGYKWCKVEADNPKASGWAPARYLVPLNPTSVPDAEIAASPPPPTEVTAAKPGEDKPGRPPASSMAQANAIPQPEPAPAGGDAAAKADAVPAPAPKADAGPAADNADAPASADAAHKPAMAPDLAARLGGPQPWTPRSVAEIGRAAMQDAYGLAFATQDEAVQATQDQDQPGTDKPQQDAMAEPAAAAEIGSSDGGIPIPTPRPTMQGDAAPALDPQTVARVDPSPGRAPDATAEIPCARYVGQPMARCQASVQRNGTGKSEVTVTWPDGGTRVISFYDGQPAGSNSRSDFRFTREGNLNMIRVGASERFEITDAIAFGD